MKIVSISTVKNECDIIESFIRYTIAYVDTMHIVVSRSGDNTLQIIKKLADEGLPIIIYQDNTFELNYFSNINKLLQQVLASKDVTWVLPLDADEFYLAPYNPRNAIEQLIPEHIYSVRWKTFIPHLDDDESIAFIPRKLRYARACRHENFTKVILPANLARNLNATVDLGGHTISPAQQYKQIHEIRLGHIPVRSEAQLRQKILVNCLTDIACKKRQDNQNRHWYALLQRVLDPKEPLNVQQEALKYACNDLVIEEEQCIIDTSFCPKPYVRYKNLVRIDPMTNFLHAIEHLLEKIQCPENSPVSNYLETPS